MRPIIHSIKHLVQVPFNPILTGTAESDIIIDATQRGSATASNQVDEGATVKAVYIEMWTQNSANDGHEIAILEKLDQNASGATFSEMANLFAYNNKKNILWTHQGLTSNDGVGNPIPIIRQWVKIPKGKQRFGFEDKFVLTISNPSSNTLNRCGCMIYKELD